MIDPKTWERQVARQVGDDFQEFAGVSSEVDVRSEKIGEAGDGGGEGAWASLLVRAVDSVVWARPSDA